MAVSSWQWLWDFEREAHRNGDGARIRLASYGHLAGQVSHESPDEKLALYQAGRDLARHLGERWWEMFYEHWVIEVLLFGKRQPHRALDHAARAVFETSKPEFAAFPQRISLQMNLASAYTGIDPIGYESELRALFGHIEAGCDQYPSNRAYYWQLWASFLWRIEDAQALEAAYRYLQAGEETGHDHYIWSALNMVCTALVRFAPEAARGVLGDLAAAGEEIAHREARERGVAELLMWRALAARWNGHEREAQRLYRRAMMLQARLAPPRNAALLGAVEFHLAGGETEAALGACQADIRILSAHGLDFALAQRRLKKCELLIQLGRDYSREARRLRRVAAKLRSKGHWEARLAQLEAGSEN